MFLAPIASFISPKITAPVVIASKILDKLTSADDKILKENVFGITATALYLDEIIKEFKEKKELDLEKLSLVSQNLKQIDLSLDKFYKLIS